MKKLLKISFITAILTCLYSPLFAAAGTGHSHAPKKEVSKITIKKQANDELKKLVTTDKIDKSWLKKPILNMEKKKFYNNMEWVISYQNKDISDAQKQTLYVFVNKYGKVTGANYTGK